MEIAVSLHTYVINPGFRNTFVIKTNELVFIKEREFLQSPDLYGKQIFLYNGLPMGNENSAYVA